MFLSSLYTIVIKIAFLHHSISCSFLCPDECGLYGEKDRTGPRLQNLCTSMNNTECRVEAMRNQTTKIMLQNRSNKIVGGLKSKHPMPWMALIRMGEKFKSYICHDIVQTFIGSKICGGSVVSNQFILTAAHCFCDGVYCN